MPEAPSAVTSPPRPVRDNSFVRDIVNGTESSPIKESSDQQVDSILQTLKIIKENGPDAEQAKKLLGTLLERREDYYFAVASIYNRDIRRVGKFLYRVGSPETGQVFGSIVSILDATPAVIGHSPLARKLLSEIPGNADSLIGEDVGPSASIESNMVVLSGSGAQKRINLNNADLDFAEFIRIKAQNKEHAAALLARGIQNHALNPQIDIIGEDGSRTTLHLSIIRVGKHPEGIDDSNHRITPWTIEEVSNGYREIVDKEGTTHRIDLAKVCLDPTDLRFEYLAIGEDGVHGLEKVVFVEASDPSGKTLINSSYEYPYPFDQVYFSDPTSFGLIDKANNPESFINYLVIAARYMEKHLKPQNRNSVAYAHKLYRILKAIGSIEQAQEVAAIFSTDGAKMHQLISRYRFTKEAIRKGFAPEQALEDLFDKMREVITKPENRRFFKDKQQVAIDSEKISRTKALEMAYDLMKRQSDESLIVLVSKLKDRLGFIAPLQEFEDSLSNFQSKS